MGVLDWVKGDASARSSRQGSMISKDDDARSLLLEGEPTHSSRSGDVQGTYS